MVRVGDFKRSILVKEGSLRAGVIAPSPKKRILRKAGSRITKCFEGASYNMVLDVVTELPSNATPLTNAKESSDMMGLSEIEISNPSIGVSKELENNSKRDGKGEVNMPELVSYKQDKHSTQTDGSLSEKDLLRSTITLEKGKKE